MAVIKLNNGQDKTVTAEVGASVWRVLSGENDNPTKEQEEFALKVNKIYLNWRNAPDSYLLAHRKDIADAVKGSWMCDKEGNLTRPEPSDKDNWRVSRLLGLIN